MGGQHDPFIGGAGDLRHHVPGFAGVFVLFDDDLRGGMVVFDDLNRILGVAVDCQGLLSFGSLPAKAPLFFLVDVIVAEIDVAVVGDDSRGAGFRQVLIDPVA